MLFDTWAGILPPRQFRRLVIEPTKAIVAALRQRFPHVPVIGFPRLAGMMIGEYCMATEVQGVGLDTSMDLGLAVRALPSRVAMQGNLDPLALVAGGPALGEAVDSILGAMRGRPFIFNLGHGIVPQTPTEHVAALVKQVRSAG
jgi:uroporphyrinogen decarboxylase